MAPKSERPLLGCASLAAAEAVTASMPCPGLKHHADPATNSMRGVGVGLDHQRPARKIGDGIGVRWCNRQVAINDEACGTQEFLGIAGDKRCIKVGGTA